MLQLFKMFTTKEHIFMFYLSTGTTPSCATRHRGATVQMARGGRPIGIARLHNKSCELCKKNLLQHPSFFQITPSSWVASLRSPTRLRLATAYSPPSASPSAGCCPPLLALMCPPPPRLASPHPPRLRSWYRVSPFVLHQMPPSSPPSSSTNAASSGGRTPTRRSSELKMALWLASSLPVGSGTV
jgi:hypothetical protein